MATISKTKFGTYRVQVRCVGQPSVTQTFKCKQDADEWALKTEYEIRRGSFIDRSEAERVTFGELVERYLNEVSVLKKGHQQEVPRLKGLKFNLGQYRVLQIQSKHIAQYRDDRLSLGKSPSTVLNELSLISQVFDTAIKEWSIPLLGNPCLLIKKPRPAKGRNRRLEKHEEHALLTACKASRAVLLHELVVMAIETGMRLGELLSLTWSDVDLVRKTAYLHTTKNGESRTVPLSTKAIYSLSIIPRNLHNSRVFWTWASKDGVENAWRRVCKKAGIEDLHFHDLRHEATSRFFERGLNMMEVASITGHKTLQMLKRYTHLKAENLAEKLG